MKRRVWLAWFIGLIMGMLLTWGILSRLAVPPDTGENITQLRRTPEELPGWAHLYGTPGVDEDAEKPV